MADVASQHIAIIGAGATGCCAALELAQRGYRVSLFEKNIEAVAEASYVNEGKIHLGFIYAKDDSLRTARNMIDGALVFEDYLQRWTDYRAADALSTPFLYGVHRDSLVELDQLLAHYSACRDYYHERAQNLGLNYLGLDSGFEFQPLAESERPYGINPEFIPSLVQTSEYAVDPRYVADFLRKAIRDEARINFCPGHTVNAIEDGHGSGYQVRVSHDDKERIEAFTQVVNASWYRRLPLDKPMGIEPPGSWSHRYKFGNRVGVRLSEEQLPSITCVQGPFGDIVNFGDRGFFLSWYPTGRTGMSSDEVPPDWPNMYSPDERFAVFERSREHWNQRCGALRELQFEQDAVDPAGGVIYALGTTDVDITDSRLHDRFDIGLQSKGGYHSVDSGKYTLSPLMGMAVADRVCGIS